MKRFKQLGTLSQAPAAPATLGCAQGSPKNPDGLRNIVSQAARPLLRRRRPLPLCSVMFDTGGPVPFTSALEAVAADWVPSDSCTAPLAEPGPWLPAPLPALAPADPSAHHTLNTN